MFITVLMTVCVDLSSPGTCVTTPVVNSNQDDVTMGSCMGLVGLESAREFWEQHPLYHSWQFKGWSCQIATARRPPRARRSANSIGLFRLGFVSGLCITMR
jgi:hypothetical protein